MSLSLSFFHVHLLGSLTWKGESGVTDTLSCQTREASTGGPCPRAGAGCGAHDWASGPRKTPSYRCGPLPTVSRLPGPWALGLTAGAQKERHITIFPLREQPHREAWGWPHGRWGFEQVTRGRPLGSSPLSPALPGSHVHQRHNTTPWRVPECVLCVTHTPPQEARWERAAPGAGPEPGQSPQVSLS